MSWKGNKMANGEIYEKNLSNASGIGSGDYLRTVNSNNESEKINYTLLAKAIIEQWAGSTLAGSAQTVKSAIDALEGVSLDYTRSLTSSDDCNTLTQGVYIFSQSVPQNAPSGVQYGTLIVIQGQTPSASTVYNFQLLSVSGRGLYYRRQQGASGDVFTNWTKVAKQEDIDSLNSNSMTVKSILSSSDDLNDLTNGVYIWATARPQNIPVSENYGLVIVFEGNQGGTYYNFQLCSLSSRRLYYRRKQGDASGSFAAWSLVTATQV
jgi:hypothetical protein